MLSAKIIAVQDENRTKPVMQDFLYFVVVNTYKSANYRNHNTHKFCRHITVYTPFRDISQQAQPLEKNHGKHNLTDTSRHTQNIRT